jgi:formate hydrogenlyase subunit 3/multisubunit Na+/H+ antiporter MnhD subunit
MQDKILLLLIALPLGAGLLNVCLPRRGKGPFALLISLAALAVSTLLFGKESLLKLGGIGFGIELNFRLYHFSSFIVLAACFFSFLIVLYTASFLKNKNNGSNLFTYILFSLGAVNAAVLADNLIVMLFFWEGLLLTIFGMIAEGRGLAAFKTAIKAFVIVGITDLCLLAGIALTGKLAGTLNISGIHLATGGVASLAFLLLVIGAISKAGSMPFHTWIPDAAIDAPLPFMAYFPGALEKLIGIYFLTRICLDLFALKAGSALSTLLMVVGAVTIVLAVMMALIQKDYKRLLSYHAISQVGYMILGIGTALPVGIAGGLFHMLNNALYKSGLFLTAGAVEKEAGTTDLQKLGGLARKMPVTFISFFIAAVSISGVPPFNGFFSKELVYDAALQRGVIFYVAAVLGSFFTAASFLKLGHAAFLGKLDERNSRVKEAPLPMLAAMVVIALCCVAFGVYNYLPLTKFISPVLGERLGGHHLYGFPANTALVVITVLVLLAALANHLIGVKINGSGIRAVDHIHHFPLLHAIYDLAEKKYFDPYEIGLKAAHIFARILWGLDRFNDWLYDGFTVGISRGLSGALRWMHNGDYAAYILWSLFGAAAVVIFMVR